MIYSLKEALTKEVGTNVRTDVLIRSQKEMPTKTGGVFVIMEVVDEEGFVADFISFKSQPNIVGTIVLITGTVNEYQGKRNFILKGGVVSEKPAELFAHKSQGEMYMQLLRQFAGNIDDVELSNAALTYLTKFNEELVRGAGASAVHHNYAGGLAHHLYEVVLYADAICGAADMIGRVNRDVVLFSCIIHDHGKIFVYDVDQFTGNSEGNDYGKFSDHLVPTITMLHTHYSDLYRFNEILHCILAHHGKLEWGALKEPASMEAFIVHTADQLSTTHSFFMKAAETTPSGWTKDKIFPLNRRIFITEE